MVSDPSQRVTALQSHRRRPIIRRLWESYLTDLRDVLFLYDQGDLSYDATRESMAEIVPALKMLEEDGELSRAIRRAEVVIVDRVLADLHEAPKGEQS